MLLGASGGGYIICELNPPAGDEVLAWSGCGYGLGCSEEAVGGGFKDLVRLGGTVEDQRVFYFSLEGQSYLILVDGSLFPFSNE